MLVGVILVVLVVAAALAAATRRSGPSWNAAFQHVARRFHGVFQPGGWFREPSVWMQHGSAQARLTVFRMRGSGDERCVQMTIQQAEARARCEIYYHQTRPPLLPVMRGLFAVEFDWEDFRRRWQVLAADGDEVRHILSDGVRLAIDQLWLASNGGRSADMTVSLSPGWLVVRKVWRLPRGIDVEEFVERVNGLSDQLNLAAAAGIEFVAGDEPQIMDAANCGVCGESLASDIVVCRRCNTPHHRDCWDYGGGCATYGCGGRQCFTPGIAPLAQPQLDNVDGLERPGKPR